MNGSQQPSDQTKKSSSNLQEKKSSQKASQSRISPRIISNSQPTRSSRRKRSQLQESQMVSASQQPPSPPLFETEDASTNVIHQKVPSPIPEEVREHNTSPEEEESASWKRQNPDYSSSGSGSQYEDIDSSEDEDEDEDVGNNLLHDEDVAQAARKTVNSKKREKTPPNGLPPAGVNRSGSKRDCVPSRLPPMSQVSPKAYSKDARGHKRNLSTAQDSQRSTKVSRFA